MKLFSTLLFGLLVLVIDLPWISMVMAPAYRNFYKRAGLTLKTQVLPAAIAYAIMTLSYYLLIVDSPRQSVLIRAASVGFVSYGIYAFTLLAILPEYPAWLALAETAWGTALYSVCTMATYYLQRNMEGWLSHSRK